MKLNVAFLAAAMLSEASALGINCRGSGNCNSDNWPSNTAQRLVNLINQVPDNRWYNNGQQIACVSKQQVGGGVCAFFQNTGGWDGRKAKQMARYIPNHGCQICGSVPTGYPGTNDVAQGQLTFNYVSNPCTSLNQAEKVC